MNNTLIFLANLWAFKWFCECFVLILEFTLGSNILKFYIFTFNCFVFVNNYCEVQWLIFCMLTFIWEKEALWFVGQDSDVGQTFWLQRTFCVVKESN